jgi:hypothetical protein
LSFQLLDGDTDEVGVGVLEGVVVRCGPGDAGGLRGSDAASHAGGEGACEGERGDDGDSRRSGG